jgi:hypothetical protein
MSKSIGSNIKTIIKQSINIPLELITVSVEVVSDAANLASSAISNTVPTVNAVAEATTRFAVGAANPELGNKELDAKTADLSFEGVLQGIVDKSGKAGQSTSNALLDFFADEEPQK